MGLYNADVVLPFLIWSEGRCILRSRTPDQCIIVACTLLPVSLPFSVCKAPTERETFEGCLNAPACNPPYKQSSFEDVKSNRDPVVCRGETAGTYNGA
jgi:hypothetical protein